MEKCSSESVYKIFAYVGNVNIDISTPNTHFIDLISGINEQTSASVLDFNLYQNYSNPFNPSTRNRLRLV